ncbi:aminotransferase class V-fold PLP-dependent enzyme [Corynebacterium alimapuense]|uniref:Cysteine desulfurase n=1 Tax=Corynebacterium alimapuense TaxID=1576874 RepID=A0A3M8K4S4_9CORY|nr:aminotransferase class V-fold PLP-dependent enzyme [Corynebacterium alimapuense]RNE48223.1 cysteine desulfurase [Corynebacterium alimapuense]
MSYDVASVRGQYVSLGDGWTYLNAHARPQIPETVSAAVSRSFRLAGCVADAESSSGSHSKQQTAGRLEADSLLASARIAVADLCGSSPERVVLGSSLPSLYMSLSQAMRPLLRHNSSVVLSRLDSPELNYPLEGLSAEVRWAQPDLGTGMLPSSQYTELVDGSTRLVSLSAAQSLLGTVAPVAEIVDYSRSRSRAWVLVEASAYAAYRPLAADQWDADIVALDLAALGGPQLGALVFRDSAMFRRLDQIREAPVAPGLAGGVPAMVGHLAGLSETIGTRRTRLQRSMGELDGYLKSLTDELYFLLGGLSSVHILGVSGEAGDGGAGDRVPRLSFAVRGVPAETVHQRLIDNGLVTTILPASQLFSEMGVDEVGGAVTASLAPFNTRYDIEHLTRVVASLA